MRRRLQRLAILEKFLIDVIGGVEVFGGDAEGFEEGDVGGVLAAGPCCGEDLAYFGLDGGFGNAAFLFGDEEVAGFIEKGFVLVGEEFCFGDGFGVDFAGIGGAGADDIEMCARADPFPLQDGLAGCGDGADDIGAFGGLLWGVGCSYLLFFCIDFLGEFFGVAFVAAPDTDVLYGTDEGDRFEMSCCLFAGAEDGEGGGFLCGEEVGGDGADGGGADRGDLFGVEEHERGAVVAIEEDDDALVGGVGGVVMKYGDELNADEIGASGVSGHHAEEPFFVGEPHEGAQGLEDLTGGQIVEHGFHERDGLRHGEEGGDG